MNLHSLGYRTDLIFPHFDDSVVNRGDYLVIRPPANPPSPAFCRPCRLVLCGGYSSRIGLNLFGCQHKLEDGPLPFARPVGNPLTGVGEVEQLTVGRPAERSQPISL